MCEGTGCWDHSWHTVNTLLVFIPNNQGHKLQSGCQIAICATDSVWSRHGADFGCNVVAYNCTAEHLWLQSILCVSGPEREMQWDSCALAKALWLGNCLENGKTWEWELANGNQNSSLTEWQVSGSISSTDGNKSQSKYTPQQRTMLLASLRLNPSLEISDLILWHWSWRLVTTPQDLRMNLQSDFLK